MPKPDARRNLTTAAVPRQFALSDYGADGFEKPVEVH